MEPTKNGTATRLHHKHNVHVPMICRRLVTIIITTTASVAATTTTTAVAAATSTSTETVQDHAH